MDPLLLGDRRLAVIGECMQSVGKTANLEMYCGGCSEGCGLVTALVCAVARDVRDFGNDGKLL